MPYTRTPSTLTFPSLSVPPRPTLLHSTASISHATNARIPYAGDILRISDSKRTFLTETNKIRLAMESINGLKFSGKVFFPISHF